MVEPRERAVRWLAWVAGDYLPIERSRLVDLCPDDLVERIDWPAVGPE